jgi:hypothetical protein
MRLSEDITFTCPYCWQTNWLTAEVIDNGFQKHLQDCEVCCRPLVVHVYVENNAVADIQAEQENA